MGDFGASLCITSEAPATFVLGYLLHVQDSTERAVVLRFLCPSNLEFGGPSLMSWVVRTKWYADSASALLAMSPLTNSSNALELSQLDALTRLIASIDLRNVGDI